jgi:hypothetical protein
LCNPEAKKLLKEEIPEAYKDVSRVVDVVHCVGLPHTKARLRPLGFIKGWEKNELFAAQTTLKIILYQFARRRSTKKQNEPKKSRKCERIRERDAERPILSRLIKDVQMQGTRNSEE